MGEQREQGDLGTNEKIWRETLSPGQVLKPVLVDLRITRATIDLLC
jgi:hypothetical protein